jgi:DNA invertase Pin-like site-specific DNA recombinase
VTVAAYVRVSSRSQNYATQVETIKRASEARGDEIGAWHVEKKSASKLDRPVLNRVRELARGGEIQRLYVFRLDRLARTGVRDLLTVLDELRGGGCRVVSLADGFDLEGPASDVVVAVLAWAAQMERLALGERIAAARARIEAKGGAWGRPRRLTTEQVDKIQQRHKAGRSIRQISVALKVPRSTVAEVVSGKGAYGPPRPKPKKKAPKKKKHPTSG